MCTFVREDGVLNRRGDATVRRVFAGSVSAFFCYSFFRPSTRHRAIILPVAIDSTRIFRDISIAPRPVDLERLSIVRCRASRLAIGHRRRTYDTRRRREVACTVNSHTCVALVQALRHFTSPRNPTRSRVLPPRSLFADRYVSNVSRGVAV